MLPQSIVDASTTAGLSILTVVAPSVAGTLHEPAASILAVTMDESSNDCDSGFHEAPGTKTDGLTPDSSEKDSGGISSGCPDGGTSVKKRMPTTASTSTEPTTESVTTSAREGPRGAKRFTD